MARTKITATTLKRDEAVAPVAAQAADATNGMYMTAGVDGKTFIRVVNGGTAAITTTVTEQIPTVQGDLSVVIPAGEERLIGPLETAHFEHDDEAFHLDFSAATSVTVAAYRLP